MRAIVSSRDAKGVVEETRSRSSGWDSGTVQRCARGLEVQQQHPMSGARAEARARLVGDHAELTGDGLTKEAPRCSALSGGYQRARNHRPGGPKNQSHVSVVHPSVVSALNEYALIEREKNPVDERRERAEVAGREFEFARQHANQAVGLVSRESAAGDEVREAALDFKKIVGRVHAL